MPTGDGRHQKPMKAPVVPTLPGPETELDRARKRLQRQSQLEIIAIFAPTHLAAFLGEEE